MTASEPGPEQIGTRIALYSALVSQNGAQTSNEAALDAADGTATAPRGVWVLVHTADLHEALLRGDDGIVARDVRSAFQQHLDTAPAQRSRQPQTFRGRSDAARLAPTNRLDPNPLDQHSPDHDSVDSFHPQADPPVPGKANLHQIRDWITVMDRINQHYDPDGILYPTPADHIVHHGRECGIAGLPPAGCPGEEAHLWTTAECHTAAAYCNAYLTESPGSFPPVVPPRPERPYSYRLPWRTVAAFHDACERLDISPLAAAALALDAAFVSGVDDPDEIADMLATMADDLCNYGQLGSVNEIDSVRPDDPHVN